MLTMALPSPAGDGAVEATLVVARCICRVVLVMLLPSHAGNGAAGITSLWHGVYAKSSWRQCYPVLLAIVLLRRLGCGTM
jgi:hypothetical protein